MFWFLWPIPELELIFSELFFLPRNLFSELVFTVLHDVKADPFFSLWGMWCRFSSVDRSSLLGFVRRASVEKNGPKLHRSCVRFTSPVSCRVLAYIKSRGSFCTSAGERSSFVLDADAGSRQGACGRGGPCRQQAAEHLRQAPEGLRCPAGVPAPPPYHRRPPPGRRSCQACWCRWWSQRSVWASS